MLVFQKHVVDRGQATTCPKDVLNACLLAEQGIYHWGALWHQWGLAQVTEEGQDGVELLILVITLDLEADALAQLGQDDQVQNDGAGQQRVLTCVVQHDCVPPTHHDLTGVLIHGTLGVAHIRHILNNDCVVWFLTGVVQQPVGIHHVIDYVALGNLKQLLI